MIAVINSQGGLVSIQDEDLHQGSTKLNKIDLVAPFADNVTWKANFEMPDGTYKPENLDGYVLQPSMKIYKDLNVWKLPITFPITQDYGIVTMQLRGYIGDTIVCTTSIKLPIQKGVPYDSNFEELSDKDQLLQMIGDLRALANTKVDKVNYVFDKVENVTESTVGIYFVYNDENEQYESVTLPQEYIEGAEYFQAVSTGRVVNTDNNLYLEYVDNESGLSTKLEILKDKVTINDKQVVVFDDLKAENISFDNSNSGLQAENTQQAIEEVNDKIENSVNEINADINNVKERVENVNTNLTNKINNDIENLESRVLKIDTDKLLNYYLKSETYTRDEVNNLISKINSFKKEIVNVLPTENIYESTIYLVPVENGSGNNYYEEYLYINGRWELIGTTAIDLTNYVKKTDYATGSKAGVVSTPSWGGLEAVNGQLYIKQASDDQLLAKAEPYLPVTAKKLDMAVKIGVTTNTIPLTDEEKAKAQEWLGIAGSGGVSAEEFNKLVNNETQIVNTQKRFYAGGAKASPADAAVVAIGTNADPVGNYSVVIGVEAESKYRGVSIGHQAKATQDSTIQLGKGTNETENTLQIFDKNIYNHSTDTLTVANITLNGENLADKLENVGGANITNIGDTITSGKFEGVVHLSEEQYQELITNGSITIGGETFTYNENAIYVTPENSESGGGSAKKYQHNIYIMSTTGAEIYFSIITTSAELLTANTIISEIDNKTIMASGSWNSSTNGYGHIIAVGKYKSTEMSLKGYWLTNVNGILTPTQFDSSVRISIAFMETFVDTVVEV